LDGFSDWRVASGLTGKSGNVEISACGPLADTAAGVTSAQAVQSDGSNGQYERF